MIENKGVYHDGLTAKGWDCELSVQDALLHLYLNDENKTLLIWNISAFKSCQYSGSVLNVAYGDYPHQSLECSGDIAKEIYDAWAGEKIIPKAEGMVFSGKATAAIVLTAIFILLGVYIYFYLLPWAGEKSAAIIPRSTEIELGESIASAYEQGNEINDSAGYYINQFASKINFNSDYDLKIQVINSEQINAFAIPGGKIFVYSGIVNKMESYEELVALLGHEATHVIKRHSLKSICRSAAGSFFIAALFGDVTGISAGILSQADQFKQLGYSRELETEADDNGYEIMTQNNINPEGMLHLLQLLEKEGEKMPGMMKYLSTHPETEARIENISNKLPKNKNENKNEELKRLFKRIQFHCED